AATGRVSDRLQHAGGKILLALGKAQAPLDAILQQPAAGAHELSSAMPGLALAYEPVENVGQMLRVGEKLAVADVQVRVELVHASTELQSPRQLGANVFR